MNIIKNINKSEISIERNEVLRYLRYKNQEIESSFSEKIDLAIEETKKIITPKAIYGIYPIKFLKNKIEIEGTNLVLESKDILRLLRGCEYCILMVATIGTKIDMEIRKTEYVDLSKSIIMDSAATTFIERCCDAIQNDIKKEFEKNKKHLTMRYSPGYGDLPLECGKEILNILQSQKIGVTSNDKGIMIPRKSVNAIIGIYDSNNRENMDIDNKRSCANCKNYNNCIYRRESEGYSCGN